MSRAKREITCPHCGRKDAEYRHSLNKGLVNALRRLYEAAGAKAETQVHVGSLGLSHCQQANFQKLKYWGLAGTVGLRDGKWFVTGAGHAFLRLWTAIPKHVWSYKGVRTKYSPDEEIIAVYATEVIEGYKVPAEWGIEVRPVGLDAIQLPLLQVAT